LKTNEITAAEFVARFGSDVVKAGAFSYFICDNGLGLIRNNADRSVEIVQPPHAEISELSPEDELQLLSLICGDFSADVELPPNDTIFDFERRERSSRRTLHAIWVVFALFLVIMLAIFAYNYLG